MKGNKTRTLIAQRVHNGFKIFLVSIIVYMFSFKKRPKNLGNVSVAGVFSADHRVWSDEKGAVLCTPGGRHISNHR